MSPSEKDPTSIVGQEFILEYCDAAGQRSSRRIVVRGLEITVGNYLALDGWCDDLGRGGTFRVDRIVSLAWASTGELILDPIIFVRSLSAHIPLVDSTERILYETKYGIRLLLLLARCDGSIHPAEVDAIRTFVDKAAGGRIYNWDKFVDFISRDKRVRKLEEVNLWFYHQDARAREMLLRTCEDMVRCDGPPNETEKRTLAAIRQSLTAP